MKLMFYYPSMRQGGILLVRALLLVLSFYVISIGHGGVVDGCIGTAFAPFGVSYEFLGSTMRACG